MKWVLASERVGELVKDWIICINLEQTMVEIYFDSSISGIIPITLNKNTLLISIWYYNSITSSDFL
jgi:hypothetical protein